MEIYPLAKGQINIDKYLRLGFEIENFDEVIKTLTEKGFTFQSAPVQTEFGFMAVAVDPEGRKVELYKKSN